MKKSTKLFLAFAAMTTIGFSASAQKSTDLEIKMTAPTNNSTYQYGDTVFLSFDVTNNGDDALAATDTLWVGLVGDQKVFPMQHSGIAKGVTFAFEKALQLVNQQTEDLTADLCLRLYNQSDITRNGEPIDVTYNDDDTTNNVSCVTNVTLKAKTASINDIAQKEELGIYPNPATSVINMDMNLTKSENVVATVRDIAGREVLRQDFGRVQAGNTAPFTVSVSALNPGLYFVELNAGERKAIGKVTVK